MKHRRSTFKNIQESRIHAKKDSKLHDGVKCSKGKSLYRGGKSNAGQKESIFGGNTQNDDGTHPLLDDLSGDLLESVDWQGLLDTFCGDDVPIRSATPLLSGNTQHIDASMAHNGDCLGHPAWLNDELSLSNVDMCGDEEMDSAVPSLGLDDVGEPGGDLAKKTKKGVLVRGYDPLLSATMEHIIPPRVSPRVVSGACKVSSSAGVKHTSQQVPMKAPNRDSINEMPRRSYSRKHRNRNSFHDNSLDRNVNYVNPSMAHRVMHSAAQRQNDHGANGHLTNGNNGNLIQPQKEINMYGANFRGNDRMSNQGRLMCDGLNGCVESNRVPCSGPSVDSTTSRAYRINSMIPNNCDSKAAFNKCDTLPCSSALKGYPQVGPHQAAYPCNSLIANCYGSVAANDHHNSSTIKVDCNKDESRSKSRRSRRKKRRWKDQMAYANVIEQFGFQINKANGRVSAVRSAPNSSNNVNGLRGHEMVSNRGMQVCNMAGRSRVDLRQESGHSRVDGTVMGQVVPKRSLNYRDDLKKLSFGEHAHTNYQETDIECTNFNSIIAISNISNTGVITSPRTSSNLCLTPASRAIDGVCSVYSPNSEQSVDYPSFGFDRHYMDNCSTTTKDGSIAPSGDDEGFGGSTGRNSTRTPNSSTTHSPHSRGGFFLGSPMSVNDAGFLCDNDVPMLSPQTSICADAGVTSPPEQSSTEDCRVVVAQEQSNVKDQSGSGSAVPPNQNDALTNADPCQSMYLVDGVISSKSVPPLREFNNNLIGRRNVQRDNITQEHNYGSREAACETEYDQKKRILDQLNNMLESESSSSGGSSDESGSSSDISDCSSDDGSSSSDSDSSDSEDSSSDTGSSSSTDSPNVKEPEELNRCSKCDLRFATFDALERHVMNVHNELLLTYCCDACSMKFASRLALFNHRSDCGLCHPERDAAGQTMRAHPRTEFSCHHCGQAFPRHVLLRDHLVSHMPNA